MYPSLCAYRAAAALLGLAATAAAAATPAAFGQPLPPAASPARTSARPAPAAPKRAAAAAPLSAGSAPQNFVLVARSCKEQATPTGSVLTLGGDVTITAQETKLQTDGALFDRTAQVATSAGRMQFEDAQQTLTGASGTANYQAAEADLRGAVQVAIRSLPENGARTRGTLTGDACAYNWKERVATLQGNVALKLRDRTVTADRAVYNGRAQTVALTGNVQVVNDQGETITGSRALLVLKPGAEETSRENGARSVRKVRDGGSAPLPAASAPVTAPSPDTSGGARVVSSGV